MDNYFTYLSVHQLRSLENWQGNIHSNVNVISGKNGSGKSTFLEAIYLIASGRSFRTRETTPLITDGKPYLIVKAKTNHQDIIKCIKSKNQKTSVSINELSCKSSSELAVMFPVQVFHQGLFPIIDAGATTRRSLLDWGVFHVEHSYVKVLKQYYLVIKQRNHLLKQRAKYEVLEPWDHQLSQLANEIHSQRTDYFTQWHQYFYQVLTQLSEELTCELIYEKGWGRQSDEALLETLKKQYTHDLKRQHTTQGPHTADIIIKDDQGHIKHTWSRGQQKIIFFALKLAQSLLISKPCIYLFDDLAAELDTIYQDKLLTYISNLSGQVFYTSLPNDISNIKAHFKHAHIIEL